MLHRLTRSCIHHRRRVVAIWLLAIVGFTLAASSFGGDHATGASLPGTDSDVAYQRYLANFPTDPFESARMVFEDERGLAAAAPGIAAFVERVRQLPGVTAVASPLDDASAVSADGTIGYADVVFDGTDPAVIERAAAPLRAAGTHVDFSSGWFQSGGVPSTEGFGLLAAAVILLLAFGSVVAMGLPVITAIAGVAIGLAGVELWSRLVPTPDFTVQVASMVGIGVGVDYALFIVTRHREALRRSGDVPTAIIEAISTAGQAVLFAGGTVMISLLGMFLMGLRFFYGLALGTASAVLVAVLAALTLLPALLAMVGHKLDRLSLHRRLPRTGESGWHRWSRLVQRRPKTFAAGGLALLVALGLPVLGMRQASADLGNDAVGTTTRTAYDRLAAGFGPGFNGPLLAVVDTPLGTATPGLTELRARLAATPGVAAVTPLLLAPNGAAGVIQVIPTTGPQDAATATLVHELRAEILPSSGLSVHLGGATATDVDFADLMSARLPIFIGAVLVLSFLLLMIVFRSIVVPLKAVVLNVLSIGAAYGVMVMVFQWGWLGNLIGIDGGAPIEPWAPMMLFAIVFGLSMDYEVFLLSSVKERVDHGELNGPAVMEGLASTARVITAAAAIMVCVFGSFVRGDLRAIKLIGLGLAAAVFIDATVVRMVLVPATMELLGERNWWLPQRLERVLPRLAVHG